MVGSQAHRSLIQHFTHRCIGMFLNIDYHYSRQRYADRCIPLDPLGSESEDGGRFFKGGTCLTSWPSGWVLIRGRAFIGALALILGYNRY